MPPGRRKSWRLALRPACMGGHIGVQGGPSHSKNPQETPNPAAIPKEPSHWDHPVSCLSCHAEPSYPPRHSMSTELHPYWGPLKAQGTPQMVKSRA